MYARITREIRNAARLGVLYEYHRLLGELTGSSLLTKGDYAREESYFLRHPELYRSELEALYKRVMGRDLDLERPVRFTEKIQWMKLFDSTPLKTRLADKYAVREYVASKLGERFLVPLYGHYEHFKDIDFSSFPLSFVLKCNHGCAMNIVVKDRREFDERRARKTVELWMSRNFAFQSFEMHYSAIPRRILVEKYVEQMDGESLYDYKIHCFHGRPQFIQVIGKRDFICHTGLQKFYDFDWNELAWGFENYPYFPAPLPKPAHLGEMRDCAATLSADFEYVRVDFYDIGERILFGEMTFTPASGFYPYHTIWTEDRDRELGSQIRLHIRSTKENTL